MISINPHDFRHRVTFQTFVDGTNDIGETVQVPKDLFSTFAKIVPVKPMTTKSAEFVVDEKAFPEQIYSISIWYHPGVMTDMLIVYGTRKFQIVGVSNLEERNIYLVLYCIEKVKDPL